ncbi:MAG: TIGR03619 family F420-dependent LLM class oxidoreductase [Acidimicrobiia bacterium]|nr:TIGR03619 family F420-dependent LLM class oxidoreductase [Acidimicrobiia bacterium]
MDLGLFAPLRSPVATPEFLAELGRECDERGIHSIWLGEHVVMFPEYESTYPGSRDGKFRFPAGSGLLDMVSALSFLAACTQHVRLGTGICILPQNNPVYAAKEYATVDFLSKGRLDFGVGVGWSWEEFEACGVPFEHRGARCDEYLELIRRLWCDEVSSFEGRFYTLRDCLLYPKPVQQPMVPVTVGGHSEAALRRAARVGAGWYGVNLSPAETATIVERLGGHLEAQGRPRDDLRIVVGAVSDSIDPNQLGEYAEAGVDEVLVPFLRQGSKHLAANLDKLSAHREAAAAL